MSDEIYEPIDEVYTTSGNSEWHGKAKPPIDPDGKIGDMTLNRLCPVIHEMQLSGNIDGNIVTMSSYKALVADYRECRPETIGTEHAIVPLHIPKKNYGVIMNCHLVKALKTALEGVDSAIATAGTLARGALFFTSVDLKGESELIIKRTVRGVSIQDRILAFLTLITSHNGTQAAKAYDSTTRVVCKNTLDVSLQTAGQVGFNVYHTKGAMPAIEKMGELLNGILKGRAEFVNTMEYLDSIAISHADAHAIAAGYFALTQKKSELAKKSLNAAEEILALFARGAGNHGLTAYDLLNGATDYWTNGSGTGKKTSRMEKLSSANFGSGAEHKQAFSNLLLGNLEGMKEAGKRALSVALK